MGKRTRRFTPKSEITGSQVIVSANEVSRHTMIRRELRNARRVLANHELFSSSLVCLSAQVIASHGRNYGALSKWQTKEEGMQTEKHIKPITSMLLLKNGAYYEILWTRGLNTGRCRKQPANISWPQIFFGVKYCKAAHLNQWKWKQRCNILKQLIQRIKQWFSPKTTPEIPQRKKTGLPAMERRLNAARNIVDGSLMDKDNNW